jgi:hypothetical protein
MVWINTLQPETANSCTKRATATPTRLSDNGSYTWWIHSITGDNDAFTKKGTITALRASLHRIYPDARPLPLDYLRTLLHYSYFLFLHFFLPKHQAVLFQSHGCTWPPVLERMEKWQETTKERMSVSVSVSSSSQQSEVGTGPCWPTWEKIEVGILQRHL